VKAWTGFKAVALDAELAAGIDRGATKSG